MKNEGNEMKESEIQDHYLDALQALVYIMQQSEDYYGHWIDSIQRDIRAWQEDRNSTIHLGNYGGMGSFSDLGGSAYFSIIQSIAYSLAVNPNDVESIEKRIGNLGQQLKGWHCPNCGYDEVYGYDIESYIKQYIARFEVLEYFLNGNLRELAIKRTARPPSNMIDEMDSVLDILSKNKIVVTNREKWEGNCPECETELEIFHWIMNKTRDELIPYTTSVDDLPDHIKSAFK